MLHIVQQDVAVDVGYDDVKGAFVCQGGGVALQDFNAVQPIQPDIFQGIAYAPVVDVYGSAADSALHACQDGEDGGAASHVEHMAPGEVHVEQLVDDEAGGFVVACAEGHLRVYGDVIFSFRNIVVEGAVYYTAVADDDGLEEIAFPFFVPISVFGFEIIVADVCVKQREIIQCLLKGFFIVEALLYVGGYSAGLLHETLEACVGKRGGEHIVYYLGARGGTEVELQILHGTMFVLVI